MAEQRMDSILSSHPPRHVTVPFGADNDTLHESFASFGFLGGESVASDIDDEVDQRNHLVLETIDGATTFSAQEKFSEMVSAQGVNLTVELDEDGGSLGDLSELTVGNRSYILDLAMQKEARKEQLKEEVNEAAFELYQEAKKEGHEGAAVFLLMVSECRKKLEPLKLEFYELQDERLDRALNEELDRRQEQGSCESTILVNPRPRSDRAAKFEQAITASQELIQASARMVIEMTTDGDYDWGGEGHEESGKVEVEDDSRKAKDGQRSKSPKKTKKSSKKPMATKNAEDEPCSPKGKKKKSKTKKLDSASDEPSGDAGESKTRKVKTGESKKTRLSESSMTIDNEDTGKKAKAKKPSSKKKHRAPSDSLGGSAVFEDAAADSFISPISPSLSRKTKKVKKGVVVKDKKCPQKTKESNNQVLDP
jgi:hypothetical protein